MRVLIDEDSAVQLLEPLRHLLPRHHVDHITQVKWAAKKDHSVLADAKRARYHVFITKDRSQLSDPKECAAIKKSGLHHVRYRERRQGLDGLALALGAVIAAMPMVMVELENADSQMLVQIVALEPGRRYVLNDPRKKPPSQYWPR
jgi:hypothetical protein